MAVREFLVGFRDAHGESQLRRPREEDQLLEIGTVAGSIPGHANVVTVFIRGRRHQHPHAVLFHHELQLMAPVRRVHVHQHRADFGCGVLKDGPLSTVGAPDAYPLALCHANGEQRAGEVIDVVVQLLVAPPAGVTAWRSSGLDQRIPQGELRRDALKIGTNGLFEQRDVSVSGGVGQHDGTLPSHCPQQNRNHLQRRRVLPVGLEP